MTFPARVQPIDWIQSDAAKPQVLKSRLKRLFDHRPFNGVLKISVAEKAPATGCEKESGLGAAAEFESSSVCLDKMVRNFIEDGNERQPAAPPAKCGRSRCNCFNGNSIDDSSDDELVSFSDSSANSSFNDPSDSLKSLIPCASIVERNLLADTSKIVEKNRKTFKPRDDLRKIVTNGLLALGYDASVCRSKWEKSDSVPAAGEYDYIDVIINGERVLIDVDFRSEFEVARSTSSYKAFLQLLPHVFVGKSDRLRQIIAVASDAARQSLKKKGMLIPPWRNPKYVECKWLGPHTRLPLKESDVGELNLLFPEETPPVEPKSVSPASPDKEVPWELPTVKPKRNRTTVITGLASLFNEKR